MINTDTTNNATNPAPVIPMPDAIRRDIADARALAAVLSAPAVLAVVDRFGGKIVNRRFWDALTEAAQTVDKGARFYGPGDNARYGVTASLFRTRYTISARDGNAYPAGNHEATIYNAPDTEREKTATGARLDASAVRADFVRRAEEETKTADQLEEQGARFGEFVAELRALGLAAKAILDKWRPEFRAALALGDGDTVFRASFLRDVTRENFKPLH